MRSRSRSERRPPVPEVQLDSTWVQTSNGAHHLPTRYYHRHTLTDVLDRRLLVHRYFSQVRAAGFLPIPTGKAQQRPALSGSAMGDAAPGGIDITGADRAFGHGHRARTDTVAFAHGRSDALRTDTQGRTQ